MPNRVVTLLSCVLFALTTWGQTSLSDSKTLRFKGGLVGGLTLSQIHGDGIGGFNKLGFNSGITVHMVNRDDQGLHLGIIFNQKGSIKPPNPNQDDFSTWAYRFSYVDIPILYGIPLCNFGLHGVTIELGLQPSVLVSAKENFYGDFTPTTIPIKNYDLSVVFGAHYEFGKNLRFFTRLTQSIIPITPMPDTPIIWWDNPMRNMTLEIGLILLFSLGG